MRRKGSNQHRNRYRYPWGLSEKAFINALIWTCVAGVVAAMFYLSHRKPEIISPLAQNPWIEEVRAVDESPASSPEPTLENIVNYIMMTFEDEGEAIQLWAIKCFISESGLNHEAYNYNEWNETFDYGVPQINEVHGYSIEELRDYRFQIKVAYQVYKKQGTEAWYGSWCN